MFDEAEEDAQTHTMSDYPNAWDSSKVSEISFTFHAEVQSKLTRYYTFSLSLI